MMQAAFEYRSWGEMVRYWQNDGIDMSGYLDPGSQWALQGQDVQPSLAGGSGMAV